MIKDSIVQSCTEEVKEIEGETVCIEFHAPLGWGALKALAQSPIQKKHVNMSKLGAFANPLNAQNQKINTFQTIITVYLYCNGLNKSALEVLHRLNMCASYSHLNDVLYRLSNTVGT